MDRIDVVKKAGNWVAEKDGAVVLTAVTKADAVARAADLARKTLGGASVRIHKVNGQIQEERTYPQQLDPRRSKG